MTLNSKVKNLMCFLLGIVVTFSVSRFCHAKTPRIQQVVVNSEKKQASFSDILELQKIIETINTVNAIWVGDKKITVEGQYEAALRGIMANLDDPYSEYLTKEELKDLNEGLNGTYSGVGMSIRKQRGEYMEVISPFIGSPAFRANIQIGDRVTKVDGKDIRENTAVEVSKMLKGKKGTEVTVEIIRKGLKEPLKIKLIRDNIKLDNVEYKMIDGNIGYISLLQFGEGIANEIEAAIKDLKSKGMNKLIFDLRTNPGGSLSEAVDLASLFTVEQKMVSLKYKSGKEKVFNRTKNMAYDGPMVVLVNGGSASASEILTGILKDYKRATIIGEKTYGKGVAQNILPFKTGGALKITIAKYSTPKNSDINKKGIEPDIKIKMEALLSNKGYSNETKMAQENRLKEIKKILIEIHGKKEAEKLIKQGDIQLKEAINFLKKGK